MLNKEDKEEKVFEDLIPDKYSQEQPFVPLEELMFRGRNNRNTYLESNVRVGNISGERGYYIKNE